MRRKEQHWSVPVLILLCVYSLLVHDEAAFTSMAVTTTPPTFAPSPTPASPPPGFEVSSCMYFKMSYMNISIFNSSYTNTSTDLLAQSYSHHDNIVCGGDTETFNRTYLDTTSNDPQFWIFFQFSKSSDGSDDWSMSQLKHRNMSQKDSLFTYNNCGSNILASVGQGYQCDSILCSGNEYIVSETIDSQVVMHSVTFQPFRNDTGSKSQNSYVVCGQGSPTSLTVYIVVGVVVGGTVVIAAVTILASFAYKRWRYGPYNLLD